MYLAVGDENTRKNLTFGLLQQALPGLMPEHYVWDFDANRVLRVRVVGIVATAGQMAAVLARCDAQFGPGRVQVV